MISGNSYEGIGIPGTVEGDFFRNEYEMNYLLKTSKVFVIQTYER